MSLKKILAAIEKELGEREIFKDELFTAMRKATRLSKQAIFEAHKKRFKKAEKTLEETAKLLAKLREVPPVHQRLVQTGIVHAAYQEYTEAQIFLGLLQSDRIVGPGEINVPSSAYLLGLADVIGELRRRVLDSIRKGNVTVAEKCFETMEFICDELTALDHAQHAVSEFRRKCDIARRIVEATRGDVAVENRRSSLERTIKSFLDFEETRSS